MAVEPKAAMDKGELRKLLLKSKHEPVNCAVAAGDGRKLQLALILLDRRKTPKALMKELEKQFPEARHPRFGTAHVDSDVDAKLVLLRLNAGASGLAARLVKSLKGTGFSKVKIVPGDGGAAEQVEEPEAGQAPAAAAAFDAVRTVADFDKGVFEGVVGGAERMATGVVHLAEAAGKEVYALATDPKAGEQALNRVEGSLEARARFEAEMLTDPGRAAAEAGDAAVSIATAAGRMAAKAYGEYEQAAAAGHGGEFIGEAVGEGAVLVAGAVLTDGASVPAEGGAVAAEVGEGASVLGEVGEASGGGSTLGKVADVASSAGKDAAPLPQETTGSAMEDAGRAATKASPTEPPDQADALRRAKERAKKYSSHWRSGSARETVDKIAGPNPTVTQSGSKTIYTNPQTGKEVIVDRGGKYFRVRDPAIPGRRTYTAINGNAVSNTMPNPDNPGKLMGKPQGDYNSETHFNDIDGD
jgi:hypothetical protein